VKRSDFVDSILQVNALQRADFPTIFTTHELIDFMTDHFGFNANKTVALMAAHSLGRALPTNSGYEGENG
jgi:hypothetical protein